MRYESEIFLHFCCFLFLILSESNCIHYLKTKSIKLQTLDIKVVNSILKIIDAFKEGSLISEITEEHTLLKCNIYNGLNNIFLFNIINSN